MNQCKQCGQSFEQRENFCSNCGARRKDQEENVTILSQGEIIPGSVIKKVSILNFFANIYLIFAVGFLYLTVTKGIIFLSWVVMMIILGLTLKILNNNGVNKKVTFLNREVNKTIFGFIGVFTSILMLYLVHYILEILHLL
ncbi:hypothetical protein [Anaerotignum sp.]|uniref:hypothetical protein n=1 Tax=Anaerotignum sp. TaxID=2039241 RepID=UPI003322FBAF